MRGGTKSSSSKLDNLKLAFLLAWTELQQCRELHPDVSARGLALALLELSANDNIDVETLAGKAVRRVRCNGRKAALH
jgi:hypothetical protein